MKALFKPHFVNEPHQDPALLINLFGRKESYLIDLGDISKLTGRTILRISRIFVSHTHIDHFFGFDVLLRTSLSKKEPIHIYGPKGIIKNVAGKLAGYTWNLITDYPINLYVHEINKNTIKTCLFSASNYFKKTCLEKKKIANGIIYDDPELKVSTVELDHKIPVLSFLLNEKKRVNVRKDVLKDMGLTPGPWLKDLKKIVITENTIEDKYIHVPNFGKINVAELAKKLLIIVNGESIAYITDIVFSKKNINKIKNHIKNPDILFCEAFFTSEDEDRAFDRHHLTAAQANKIASLIKAKKLIIFHFSPRYKGNFSKIFVEANVSTHKRK